MANEKRLYKVGANRVVKYTERGEAHQVISPDLSYADPEKIRISTEETGGITPDITGAETFATIVTLAESPIQQGLLLAGTDDGRAWLSLDDGGGWEELTDRFPGVPEGTWVRRVETSAPDRPGASDRIGLIHRLIGRAAPWRATRAGADRLTLIHASQNQRRSKTLRSNRRVYLR